MSVQQIRARYRPAWTFGDRLRKARRDARLTQGQLAAILGCSQANVDSWESDRNRPRDLVAMATRIEDALALERGWLLGYADGLPHLDSNQEPAGVVGEQGCWAVAA